MILIFFFSLAQNCRYVPVNLENIFSKYARTLPDWQAHDWRDMGHDRGESSCIWPLWMVIIYKTLLSPTRMVASVILTLYNVLVYGLRIATKMEWGVLYALARDEDVCCLKKPWGAVSMAVCLSTVPRYIQAAWKRWAEVI